MERVILRCANKVFACALLLPVISYASENEGETKEHSEIHRAINEPLYYKCI